MALGIPAAFYGPGDYAEFRGNPQMIARMKRQEALSKMTPAERQALKVREAQYAREAAKAKSIIGAFKQGGNDKIYLLPSGAPPAGGRRGGRGRPGKKILTDRERVPAHLVETYAMFQELALDDYNKDQWLNFFRVLPNRSISGVSLGKFRFRYDANGKMVYVPWTSATWQNFFKHEQRGRWIPNSPFNYKCSPAWEDKWVTNYTNTSRKWASKYRSTSDWRHVFPQRAGAAKCKKKKKSLWVKIRKVVVGAAVIVAAVYLGPIVVAKVKGVIAGAAGGKAGVAGGAAAAGGGGSSAVAAATTSQKILSGAKTLVGYVNKARTVKAIVKGKMPPPPIGIGGASFGQWALIVAKQKIKEEAMDLAMEKGVEYVQKKMTKKMENEIKAEIALMQAELLRLMPKEVLDMPPQPDPELAAPIKKIMIIEEKRADNLKQFIAPAAIIAGALILGG